MPTDLPGEKDYTLSSGAWSVLCHGFDISFRNNVVLAPPLVQEGSSKKSVGVEEDGGECV